MTYNNSKIKSFKGRMITISHKNGKGYLHEQSGEITASTKHLIVFDVNKSGHEIVIKYDQIIEVKEVSAMKAVL